MTVRAEEVVSEGVDQDAPAPTRYARLLEAVLMVLALLVTLWIDSRPDDGIRRVVSPARAAAGRAPSP